MLEVQQEGPWPVPLQAAPSSLALDPGLGRRPLGLHAVLRAGPPVPWTVLGRGAALHIEIILMGGKYITVHSY